MTAPPHNDRPVLVTGGAGFIGSNLADALAREGHRVIVYDSLARPGVEANLEWLRLRHPGRILPMIADLLDAHCLEEMVAEAQAVFHFAAQVAVTDSLADPVRDFEVNLRGTLGLLEALRALSDPPPLIFASTNKVYGALPDIELDLTNGRYWPRNAHLGLRGIDEERPLHFHTPYGCSKGAADQYVLDYATSFGLPATVMRMSCIYGPRQMGTEDQGWVAHFLLRALNDGVITLYGDGHQVRDVMEVGDTVAAYLAAWRHIDRVRGRAFNLGGGTANAVSLVQLVDLIAELTGRRPRVHRADWRAGDQRWFVADTRAVDEALGLGPKMLWREGVTMLARRLMREQGATRDPSPARRASVAAS